MHAFELSSVRAVPVLVAVVASFLLGALWYTALFGQVWRRLSGHTPERIAALQAKRPPPVFFGGILAADVLTAVGLALLLHVSLQDGDWRLGVHFGMLVWAVIATPIQFTAWISSDRHFGLYLIDTSFQFVRLALMGGILAGWN